MSRSRSRLLAAGALAVGVVLAGMPVGSPAVGEPESCRGVAATIVGKPGRPIGGTNTRDVIVTNGASDVYARGGDDLICVTNIAGHSVEDRVTISAGDGRDTIDTTATHGVGSSAYLGAGDDTYIGGSDRDWVEAADPWSETSPAEGTDSIDTSGGPDYVLTGGTPAVPDGDSIDLGPGADQIEVIGALAPTS